MKEDQIEEKIKHIESCNNDTKMFAAVKAIRKKDKPLEFIYDDKKRCVTERQSIYNIVEKHFKSHFNKEGIETIPKFIQPASRLRRRITAQEVKKVIQAMSNNKAAGKDRIPVELLKYACEELYEELAEILNGILETNDDDFKLGTGILIPLPKPKQPRGPVKKLRPIILFEVIRKVLSKILMDRTSNKINKYLSVNQSAYRRGRSTTDIVWAHRWIAAKCQEENLTVYLTGIDMSSAFDTIYRHKIIDIASSIFDNDEMRILHLLLSETQLQLKIEGAKGTPFSSNIGSPQGDSISGPLFNLYFENALQKLRQEIQNIPMDAREINRQWREQEESNIPNEMEYADDCDLINENWRRKNLSYKAAQTVLTNSNLNVNNDKTEHTVIKRERRKEDEKWRSVKKLGSLIGDKEDIKRRKQLAAAAMNTNKEIWKWRKHTSMKKHLKLYKVAVESILSAPYPGGG